MTIFRSKPLVISAIVVAATMSSLPTSAQVMIVKSQGPSASSLKPGSFLPKGRVVALDNGDRVTVLTASGTQVLTGKGRFTIGATPEKARSLLRAIFQPGVQRRRIASTRGVQPAALPATRESLWDVDAMAGGAFCAAPSHPIALWRSRDTLPAVVRITRLSDAAEEEVAWPAGQTLPWPNRFPVADGARYEITLGYVRKQIVWRTVDDPEADLLSLARQFEDRRCDSQLALLDAALTPAD